MRREAVSASVQSWFDRRSRVDGSGGVDVLFGERLRVSKNATPLLTTISKGKKT